MKDTFKIIVKTRGTDGQYVEQEMRVDKKTNKCYEGKYLIFRSRKRRPYVEMGE